MTSMIPVHVLGIHVERLSGAPVVMLSEQPADEDIPLQQRVLPIFVGPAEAQAIRLGIQGVTPPRPQTHDLMLNALGALDCALVGTEVTELRDGTYLAELEVNTPTGVQRISCRPSDAIALALRAGVELHVSLAVLDEAGVSYAQATGTRTDQPEVPAAPDEPALDDASIEAMVADFQDFLTDARPDDFDTEGDD